MPEAAAVRAVQARLAAWADAAEPLLGRRFATGRVRECHGDLHAGNIVRHGARLLPFDCLEFDPALRWIDILDDMAFPVMDFAARGRRDQATLLLQITPKARQQYLDRPRVRRRTRRRRDSQPAQVAQQRTERSDSQQIRVTRASNGNVGVATSR